MVKQINVMVVDDHMLVRKGLTHVLRPFPDTVVIAEAENGEEALFLCKKLQPDVVLMDVKMEGMGGITATKIIRQFYPQVRVIALGTYPDREIIKKALDARVNGYLLKSISANELVTAIRLVDSGESVFSPEVNKKLKEYEAVSERTEVRLSRQQQKVLTLLSHGLSNTEIARALNIAQPTARYHVSAILVKLNVSNRVEAAAVAVKQGLVGELVN
jgi:DNA-binding NarL/FixJ family response regulator